MSSCSRSATGSTSRSSTPPASAPFSRSRKALPAPALSRKRLGRGGSSSVRRRQLPHGEFDHVARQLAPAFDRGHIGGLRVAIEKFARLGVGLRARQRESRPQGMAALLILFGILYFPYPVGRGWLATFSKCYVLLMA